MDGSVQQKHIRESIFSGDIESRLLVDRMDLCGGDKERREESVDGKGREGSGKFSLTTSGILFSRKHVAGPDAPRSYRSDNAGEAYVLPTGRSLGPDVRNREDRVYV